MIKPILKKIICVSIAIVGGTLFTYGLVGVARYNYSFQEGRKKDLLNKYTTTLEYHEEINDVIKKLQANYKAGSISTEQFNREIKNLSSDDFIQSTIIKNQNEEYIEKINIIEEDIKRAKENNNKFVFCLISGGTPLVFSGATLINDGIEKKSNKEKEL